jgi:CheY-like chemotaxis protein
MLNPLGTMFAGKTPPYHILLVEDSEADARIVRLALQTHKLSHVLHLAKDGAEAIAFIDAAESKSRAYRLDLLLLDLHLPKRTGEEILRYLRSTENYAQTPVIVVSSSDALHDREIAFRHAALTYFRKPSQLAEFIELGGIVRRILE